MTPESFLALVARDELASAVAEVGTPCYVLFERILDARLAALRGCLGPRFTVHYAVKANPNADLLRFFAARHVGFDVASGGELAQALAAGAAPAEIEMTGPGKGDDELRAAISAGLAAINVESLAELERLEALAAEARSPVAVGLRVNPRQGAAGGIRMSQETPFGLREDELPEACARLRASQGRLCFSGVHVHRGSQILDAAALADSLGATLALVAFVHRELAPVEKVNFGGGWGIDYWDGQTPLDLDLLRERVARLLEGEAARTLGPRCRFVVEPGRFLVAEAGVYAVGLRYLKQGYQRRFAIADGGIHHCQLLAGGLGQVLRRDFRHLILPRQTAAVGEPHEISVAGSLCLPYDVLLQRALWPGVPHAGDRIAFLNCGAYGLTASPTRFLGHSQPREVLR